MKAWPNPNYRSSRPRKRWRKYPEAEIIELSDDEIYAPDLRPEEIYLEPTSTPLIEEIFQDFWKNADTFITISDSEDEDEVEDDNPTENALFYKNPYYYKKNFETDFRTVYRNGDFVKVNTISNLDKVGQIVSIWPDNRGVHIVVFVKANTTFLEELGHPQEIMETNECRDIFVNEIKVRGDLLYVPMKTFHTPRIF